MRRSPVALFAILLVLVSCGDDGGDDSASGTTTTTTATTTTSTTTTDGPDAEDCSASGMSAGVEPEGDLPPPVVEMRERILTAAVACDFATLEELALAGGDAFTYSFGSEDEPAAHWAELEAGGEEEPMRQLVALLQLPAARGEGPDPLHVWPAAYVHASWADVPAADRADVEALYSDDDIARFEQFGAYLGYRVGITPAGDWIFFVAGD